MAYIFIFSGVFPRTEVLHLMKFDLTILDLMFYFFHVFYLQKLPTLRLWIFSAMFSF